MKPGLPDCLPPTAWNEEGLSACVIMALTVFPPGLIHLYEYLMTTCVYLGSPRIHISAPPPPRRNLANLGLHASIS